MSWEKLDDNETQTYETHNCRAEVRPLGLANVKYFWAVSGGKTIITGYDSDQLMAKTQAAKCLRLQQTEANTQRTD